MRSFFTHLDRDPPPPAALSGLTPLFGTPYPRSMKDCLPLLALPAIQTYGPVTKSPSPISPKMMACVPDQDIDVMTPKGIVASLYGRLYASHNRLIQGQCALYMTETEVNAVAVDLDIAQHITFQCTTCDFADQNRVPLSCASDHAMHQKLFFVHQALLKMCVCSNIEHASPRVLLGCRARTCVGNGADRHSFCVRCCAYQDDRDRQDASVACGDSDINVDSDSNRISDRKHAQCCPYNPYDDEGEDGVDDKCGLPLEDMPSVRCAALSAIANAAYSVDVSSGMLCPFFRTG